MLISSMTIIVFPVHSLFIRGGNEVFSFRLMTGILKVVWYVFPPLLSEAMPVGAIVMASSLRSMSLGFFFSPASLKTSAFYSWRISHLQ
jgi:hypothetical protein